MQLKLYCSMLLCTKFFLNNLYYFLSTVINFKYLLQFLVKKFLSNKRFDALFISSNNSNSNILNIFFFFCIKCQRFFYSITTVVQLLFFAPSSYNANFWLIQQNTKFLTQIFCKMTLRQKNWKLFPTARKISIDYTFDVTFQLQ